MTTLDSTRITSLRQKLLERRLRGEARPARPAPAPLDAGGPAPLSHGQQRLWFLDRLAPGGAEYAVPMALRLTGELDLDALRRALDTLVRRHPALRTVYRADNGQPHQVVLDPAPVELPVVDLTRPGSAATREVMAGFVARPLDLSAGPVLRAMLIRRPPTGTSLSSTCTTSPATAGPCRSWCATCAPVTKEHRPRRSSRATPTSLGVSAPRTSTRRTCATGGGG